MRNLNELDQYRIKGFPLNNGNSPIQGAFHIQTKGRAFAVIASIDRQMDGSPVEHISISHRNEKIYPTWDELCEIKDIFFLPEEACVQFFPRKSEYVNIKGNCFHLWRPVNDMLDMRPEAPMEGV
ncbi:MAG: hypothetical protein LUC89_05770 [Oscillospiraceae bacterium]|nr:hypothetical protein [Oscillospiraceae bacterium]